MKLVKVTIHNITELQKVCSDSYAQNFANHWTENGLELYLEQEFGDERLKSDLVDKSIEYYFITLGERKVGFLKFNYNSSQELSQLPNCELEKIYILPEYKGKGIGKYALKEVLKKAKKHNIKLIFLCVIDTNANAMAFYKKLGFKFHSKTRIEVPYFKEELRGMKRMFFEFD